MNVYNMVKNCLMGPLFGEYVYIFKYLSYDDFIQRSLLIHSGSDQIWKDL